MRISHAIVAATGLSLMLGSAAEGLPARPVNDVRNPAVINFQSPQARACLRRRLSLLARFNDNVRRRLQIGCPGLLTLPIKDSEEPRPPPRPIERLHLTRTEAICLLERLAKRPGPLELALSDCPGGGRRR